MPEPIFTIGHSTHAMSEFAAMLRHAGADLVVDVRSIPRSRHNPQFNIDAMPATLAEHGIGYTHLAALGGRRHHPKGAPPSPNTLWRVAAFRNYADYAATPSFRLGLDTLEALAHDHHCAVMCAEAVWWRCHRRIIADYLLADGAEVQHIMALDKIEKATMTPGAEQTTDGTLRYPPEPGTQLGLPV